MARDFFGRRDPDDVQKPIQVTDRRRIQLNDERETDPSAAEAPNLKPSYVEELEARAKASEEKAYELQARFDLLRKQLQAETDETRQRLNKAADDRAKREKADFIAALLPALDNLERADEASASGASSEDIAEGVRRTAAGFQTALAAAGVEPIDSIGRPFDPEVHEAVETAEVDPEDEGKVLAEYSRGYKMGERLLRPARVKVGRSREKAKRAVE